MDFKDYYKVLGVESDADLKAVKAAYRKLARKYHPDVSDQEDAEERFKEVTEAYEVLSNPDKRADYDQLRQYGGQHGQTFEPPPGWQGGGDFSFQDSGYQGDFSDFFESIFGGGHRRGFGAHAQPHDRGQDVEIDLPIFLEDTVTEESKPISYAIPCFDDQGRCKPDIKKTLKVKIPKGVVNGERIRLKGQGVPSTSDGAAGDLYLRIRLVPHPLFDVEGHNLIITVPVLPWEAALGTKITLPTLQGKITLTIPEGSQSGKRLRIRGKGLPSKIGQGDLYAVLNVVMPNVVSEASKSHWQALAEANKDDARAEWGKYL